MQLEFAEAKFKDCPSVKRPFPSFRYNLGCNKEEPTSYWYPPDPTSKSRSLSLSTSKNIAATSSDSLFFIKAGWGDCAKLPSACCINNFPSSPDAPPTKKSCFPSPFTSPTAKPGP